MQNKITSDIKNRDATYDYSQSIVIAGSGGGRAAYNQSTCSNPLLSKETSKERSINEDSVTQNYSNAYDKSDRALNLIDAYRKN